MALGGLDVLVLAHGVGGSAMAGDETPEGWDAVVRDNLTGAFLVARAALPHLVERRGAIVTVASTNAWVAGPGLGVVLRVEGRPRDAHRQHRERLRPDGRARELRLPGLGENPHGRRRTWMRSPPAGAPTVTARTG